MSRIAEVQSSFDLGTAQWVPAALFDGTNDIPGLMQGLLIAGSRIVVSGSVSESFAGTPRDQDYYAFETRPGDVVQVVLTGDISSRLGLYLYENGGFVTSAVQTTSGSVLSLQRSIGTPTTFTVGTQDNSALFSGGYAYPAAYNIAVTILSPGQTLSGGAGADALSGWLGGDVLRGFSLADPLADTGNDTLNGLAGRDVLMGAGGDDVLIGGLDADRLLGDMGNDTLYGDYAPGSLAPEVVGFDTIPTYSSFGIFTGYVDVYIPTGYDDTLLGGDGDDLLVGGLGFDLLQGGAGNDTLAGGDALPFAPATVTDFDTDRLFGGEGDDLLLRGFRLSGGSGNDTLIANAGFADGGDGTDLLQFSAGGLLRIAPDGSGSTGTGAAALVFSGIENFFVTGGYAANDFQMGSGSDTVIGGSRGDTVTGGAGDDSLNGGAAPVPSADPAAVPLDRLSGDTGNDTLWANSGDASLLGGSGNDLLTSHGDRADLSGGSGHDSLLATGREVALDGGTGNDVITLWLDTGGALLRATNALVDAGSGNDTIFSIGAGDSVLGGRGVDHIVLDFATSLGGVRMLNFNNGSGTAWSLTAYVDWAEVERIDVSGGAYGDTLVGGGSTDTIDGYAGPDLLLGGGSSDVFRIRRPGGDGVTIGDFRGNGAAAGDRIEFIGFDAGSTLTSLGGTAWRAGTAASGVDLTIIGAVHPTDYVFL